MHQLDIGYPNSSLALEKPERNAGLLAGDRAPDAPLKAVAGQPTRPFESVAADPSRLRPMGNV
ncbi:hypothetical protein N2600_10025 [Rhizobium sp. WSM1274]|nr:hypothetical protein N2600_10025 [Rhizobium leguminosarum bv. viciae]